MFSVAHLTKMRFWLDIRKRFWSQRAVGMEQSAQGSGHSLELPEPKEH